MVLTRQLPRPRPLLLFFDAVNVWLGLSKRMPAYTEWLEIDKNGVARNILFVHLNYFEAFCVLVTFIYAAVALLLWFGYFFWPAVFRPIIAHFQDQGRANGRQHEQRGVLGVPAGR